MNPGVGREPRSTADLLRVVPGFYVESSGGEVGGNLFARGLPADGSYRYVALMEDGMAAAQRRLDAGVTRSAEARRR